MFSEFALAIEELSSIVGLSVIVLSVVYSGLRVVGYLAKKKQPE